VVAVTAFLAWVALALVIAVAVVLINRHDRRAKMRDFEWFTVDHLGVVLNCGGELAHDEDLDPRLFASFIVSANGRDIKMVCIELSHCDPGSEGRCFWFAQDHRSYVKQHRIEEPL
jgi:hypothetical protein